MESPDGDGNYLVGFVVEKVRPLNRNEGVMIGSIGMVGPASVAIEA